MNHPVFGHFCFPLLISNSFELCDQSLLSFHFDFDFLKIIKNIRNIILTLETQKLDFVCLNETRLQLRFKSLDSINNIYVETKNKDSTLLAVPPQ